MLSMGDETVWLTRYDIWDQVFNLLISLYMTFFTILCTIVGIISLKELDREFFDWPHQSTLGIGKLFSAKGIYP